MGESFFACAERETLEETGLKVKAARVVAVTNDVFDATSKHYITIFVLCVREDPEAEAKVSFYFYFYFIFIFIFFHFNITSSRPNPSRARSILFEHWISFNLFYCTEKVEHHRELSKLRFCTTTSVKQVYEPA